MVQQKRKKSSSKQRTCCRKRRREVFRQFSPGGKNKKATEVHWRTRILVSKKWLFMLDLLFERHDYTAIKAERMRYSQNWVLTVNAEGKQPPRQLRPDYEEAKRECQRPQDELMAVKGQLFTPIQAGIKRRQNPNQQFEGSEEYDHVVDRKRGWRWYKEQEGDLPHTSSSSSTSWQDSTWQWMSWWWHSSQYDEQWMRFLLFNFVCQCMLNCRVSNCRNAVPTIRRGVYTEYTPTWRTYSLFTSTHECECVLVAQWHDGRIVSFLCA